MIQGSNVVDFQRSSFPHSRRPELELVHTTSGREAAESSKHPSPGQDKFVLSQLELFDAINLAAAVVNSEQRVVRLNRRCERMLGVQLRVQRGRFVADSPCGNGQLRNAIQAVFSNRKEAAQGIIVAASEPPILFRALPMGRSACHDEPALALLLFCSPVSQRFPDTRLLSRVYGLTPAQARIAGHLATGASVEAVAGRLGIKTETVRTHLKQIFCKVGSRRQGELVALLSSFWFGAQEESDSDMPA